MPVMFNKNRQESGSTKNEKGIFKVSELIQEKISTTFDFCSEAFTSIKINTETMNDANPLKQAMVTDIPLLIFFPKNPLIRKPIKGNRGTKPINFIIILYEIYFFLS